jgi:hypothetical protein
MNTEELLLKNKWLEEENKKLQDELVVTKEHLKTYTNNTKRYYDKNKEEIKKKVKEYREKTNYIAPPVLPEIIKERNKKAYLKRKEKLEEMNHENI